MNIFSSNFINTISIIISIIFFLIINESLNFLFKDNSEKNFLNNNIVENKIKAISIKNKKEEDPSNWYIEIPNIKLKAPIEEGTEEKIINKSIGHFKGTATTLGNIGLAGHNRGKKKNYFEKLETLEIGSEIFYKKENFEKRYVVTIKEKIKDTNWDYLLSTKENKITLITCIENQPDYRLCVQAKEKE